MRAIRKLYRLLHAIYHDRNLLVNLAQQDFKRRFAGSYFGTLWGFINPLLTMTIYWWVFQFGFRTGDVAEHPFVLWFMSGIIVWFFFSEAFSSASNSFLEYSYLVKKVVFNINILPLVKIISCMITHFFFIVLVAIIMLLFGYYPTIYWLQLPYYIFSCICLAFAFSLIFASVIVFFRDLSNIISIILLIGMWGTPIAWSLQNFPEEFHSYFMLNPIYYLVEGYRDCFLQQTWFWEKPGLTTYFWILIVGLLLVGAFFYDRLKHSFADFL